MSRFYTANKWKVSGKQGQEISDRGYNLLRASNGYFSGQEIGRILYSHYILGNSINVIKLENKPIPIQTMQGILSGTFSPEGFNAFMELAEHEPEQLARLYKEDNSHE